MELFINYVIFTLKHFTSSCYGELSENDLNIIFNKIFSENLSKEEIRELIKNIKNYVHQIKKDEVENYIIIPSTLHIFIQKQLKKHSLQTILKDLFNSIQTNNKIDQKMLKKFLKVCDRNDSGNSSLNLSKINLSVLDLIGDDYETFMNKMEKHSKAI
ncbi:conserved protein, unknown function [Hepatocystis sp. ex Piliocolobus tephrosceles]|nr:conserved protein, unknown function [Hepatocystis sp. ex Piliocolobus tephrosceles]